MPQSLKQLDQRCHTVCANIEDAKKFATEKLPQKIQLDSVAFFNALDKVNLDQVQATLDDMEEAIRQARVAIKNEQSRRSLQDQINQLTDKKFQKEENSS